MLTRLPVPCRPSTPGVLPAGVLAVLLLAGSGRASVAQSSDRVPFDDAPLPEGVTIADVRRGRAYFVGPGGCALCHGDAGRGVPGQGSSLVDGRWARIDGSYAEILEVIREGVCAADAALGVPMPPRGGRDFDEDELRAVAAWTWWLDRRARR